MSEPSQRFGRFLAAGARDDVPLSVSIAGQQAPERTRRLFHEMGMT